MHWMIRAWRLQLMARVKIDEVLTAFRNEEKQKKKKTRPALAQRA